MLPCSPLEFRNGAWPGCRRHRRSEQQVVPPRISEETLSNPFSSVLRSGTGSMSISGPIATFWGMRKWPYYCPICGDKFGNTKLSRAKQRQHFQTFHPEFFDWNYRFGKIGNLFAVGIFIYLGLGLVLVFAEGNASVLAWWWSLGFLSICAATWIGLLYWRLQVRSFRHSWKRLRLPSSSPLLASTDDDSKLDPFLKDPKSEDVRD